MTDHAPAADPARPFDRARLLGLGAAIACISAFAVATTLVGPLIGLLLEAAGESNFRIGLNNAMGPIGMIATAMIAPGLMRRSGAPAFLATCLGATVLLFVLFPVLTSFEAWLALRFLLGASTAGLFLASEYWIVADAPPAHRGRVVALYAIALSLGYALGPAILAAVGVAGWAPWLWAIGVTTAAALPIALAWRAAPPIAHGPPVGAWRFFISAPTLLYAVVLFGLVEYGAMLLIPVWGVRVGFPETEAITLAIALALGNIASQPVIGYAADRLPARGLLLACALVSLLAMIALPMIGPSLWALYALFFAWGGVAAGLYTVALTAIGARYSGSELAAANGAVIMAYSIGALIGPPIIGGAMDAIGPNGLALAAGGGCAAYAALVVVRMRRAP